jgi:hypothetical protein
MKMQIHTDKSKVVWVGFSKFFDDLGIRKTTPMNSVFICVHLIFICGKNPPHSTPDNLGEKSRQAGRFGFGRNCGFASAILLRPGARVSDMWVEAVGLRPVKGRAA